LILIGLGLIIFSIIYGSVGNGFFIISLEFIIGLIFLIIGLLRFFSIEEKRKDLELELNK